MFTKAKIELEMIEDLIAHGKSRENFWFATHEDDITAMYFDTSVVGDNCSMVDTVSVSHRSGIVHILK